MDGSFYRDFAGNIRLKFYKKGDNYYLKTKAGVGLFENTRSTDMDTDIILYFDGEDEGDWDYVMPDGDDEDD